MKVFNAVCASVKQEVVISYIENATRYNWDQRRGFPHGCSNGLAELGAGNHSKSRSEQYWVVCYIWFPPCSCIFMRTYRACRTEQTDIKRELSCQSNKCSSSILSMLPGSGSKRRRALKVHQRSCLFSEGRGKLPYKYPSEMCFVINQLRHTSTSKWQEARRCRSRQNQKLNFYFIASTFYNYSFGNP